MGRRGVRQGHSKSGQPQIANYLGTQMPAGLPFPPGTSWLSSSPPTRRRTACRISRVRREWQIDRHVLNEATQKYTCTRAVQVSRIIQVDVAVTDARSPRDGCTAPTPTSRTERHHVLGSPAAAGHSIRLRPWTFPAVPKAESVPAQQSVPQSGVNIYQHFGCNNRLAGPVDNSQSSCMSCHGSAFAAPKGAVSNMGVNVHAVVRLQRHVHAIFDGQRRLFRQHHRAAEIRAAAHSPTRCRSIRRCSSRSRSSNTDSFNTFKAPTPCTMGN
jgi:hypothetical protein